MSQSELDRFTEAQAHNYDDALAEIKNGKKISHWMWYVFPQVAGLGNSEMAKRYAIKDIEEAKAYLAHPVLGKRLVEISQALAALESNDAYHILGSPDDMKLKSSMTLFASLPGADPVFSALLNKFYSGEQDERAIKIISKVY